ncbi:unnamed protein product, partial [Pylaiella littoralis]
SSALPIPSASTRLTQRSSNPTRRRIRPDRGAAETGISSPWTLPFAWSSSENCPIMLWPRRVFFWVLSWIGCQCPSMRVGMALDRLEQCSEEVEVRRVRDPA